METERSFSNLPPPSSCDAGEKVFRNTLLKASRCNILQGKIPNFTPGLTQQTRSVIVERDKLHATNPADGAIPLLEAIIVKKSVRGSRKSGMRLEYCSTKHCSGEYFKILRDLTGKCRPHDPNQLSLS